MEQRRIGTLNVSVCGLGCNNFGSRLNQQDSAAVVHAALDEGITFFDTAATYGEGRSEEFLGAALKGRRGSAVIATKFPMLRMGAPADPNALKPGSAASVRKCVNESLTRLGTDHIDLFQMHVPDPDTPIEETLEALDALVRAGKVLQIGNSNFSAPQIERADDVSVERGVARFVTAQNEWSLLNRSIEAEITPVCERRGLGVLPYFPLAGGALTGKYRRGEQPPAGTRLGILPDAVRQRFLNDRTYHVVDTLQQFAVARNKSLLELAMSWLACQPSVTSVIAGAMSAAQVNANVAAISWKLSAGELAEVNAITA